MGRFRKEAAFFIGPRSAFRALPPLNERANEHKIPKTCPNPDTIHCQFGITPKGPADAAHPKADQGINSLKGSEP